jgi:alanine dehydrogenase
MIVGVPREIKDGEFRVGMTPAGVRELTQAGHQVVVQQNAGAAVGFADAAYQQAGATLVATRAEVFTAELVVKVKEIHPPEYACLRPGLITFCFQHFAPAPGLLQACLDARITTIAYETVGQSTGLPILKPMSEIAGRLSIQIAMWALQTSNGGSGVLLQGTSGVAPGKVVIIGAGASGSNAAQVAANLGCRTVVFARSRRRLDVLDASCPGKITTHVYDPVTLAHEMADADAVIGAVLNPGQTSPTLITRPMLRSMRPGSVFIDIGIDQNGIAETSRPTSHSTPLFIEEGINHYCVPNMPAAVARTATLALASAALPYIKALCTNGFQRSIEADASLREGVQLRDGHVVHAHLARDTGREFAP